MASTSTWLSIQTTQPTMWSREPICGKSRCISAPHRMGALSPMSRQRYYQVNRWALHGFHPTLWTSGVFKQSWTLRASRVVEDIGLYVRESIVQRIRQWISTCRERQLIRLWVDVLPSLVPVSSRPTFTNWQKWSIWQIEYGIVLYITVGSLKILWSPLPPKKSFVRYYNKLKWVF